MRKQATVNRTPLVIAAVFVTLVASFGVNQVIRSASISEKSRQIRVLEQEIAGLKDMGEKLEVKLAEDQTIGSVESRATALGLVPAEQIEYVTPTAPVVARK